MTLTIGWTFVSLFYTFTLNYNSVENLIQLLKDQTTELKAMYIAKVREFADTEWNTQKERSNWKDVDWCKYMRIEPFVYNAGRFNEFLGFPKGFYNTSKARELSKLKNKVSLVLRKNFADYMDQQERFAVDHYNDAIAKLAYRIEKKGLDINNLTLKSTRLDFNFETIITDGNKIVRAFTILAGGPIQCPHFRYLVK